MRKKRIAGEERDCVWILYIYTKRLFILQSAAEKTDRERARLPKRLTC